MNHSEEMVGRVARSHVSVLILGETGVGKEVLAQSIHRRSPRAAQPLVTIDCASLCASLIESQLFGYEQGAFTGAVRSRGGLFEAAHGGTVFLDELGELPLPDQAKLLRVLDTRAVRSVGSSKDRPIDVRILAATNRDLDKEVRNGTFRADLLFRLDGMRFRVPPLRERRDEIPALAESLLAQASSREGVALPELSPVALGALLEYGWPGNIRELRNVMERAMVLCDSGTIELEHLLFEQSRAGDALQQRDERVAAGYSCPGPVKTREWCTRESIVRALAGCAGNQTRAAALLGISRRTLVERIKRLELPRPQKPKRSPGGTPVATPGGSETGHPMLLS